MKKYLILLFIIVFALCCAALCVIFFVLLPDKIDKPKVTIPDGSLEGVTLTDYNGGKYYAFKSIPYAKPPIGEERFRAPVKNDPWTGVLNAGQELPTCMQANDEQTETIGTEDCLYLNVYTNSLGNETLKPVMIYVFGSAFKRGTSRDYGAEYLMPEDIVLVTMNFRFNIYGHISLVDSAVGVNDKQEMSANNGFRDHIMAMKWVQQNIQHFGGDPSMVTLAGHSSGGMSVHAHVLSPLSAGLFHQAIVMSGTTLMIESLAANNTALDIAKYLGIDTADHVAMILELKRSTTADLVKAQRDLGWLKSQLDSPQGVGLMIEKPGPMSFISDYPLNIIRSRKYNKVPLLIGRTDREGLYIQLLTSTEDNMKDLNTHIPYCFNERDEVADKVIAFYGINATSEYNNISMYSDIWFKFNALRAAVEHTQNDDNGDVYFYEFAGDAGMNYLKVTRPTIAQYPGACHGDELGYLFKFDSLPEAKTGSVEETLMKRMVKMWSNFVKTSKPHDNWVPFKPDERHFVNITNDGLEFGVINDNGDKFWTDMYERYSNRLY